MEELVPNNSIVIPNMVPPTSPNGGDDIGMIQQLPRSLLSESSDGLLPPTGLNDVDMMDEIMGGAHPAPGDEMVSSTAIVSVPGSITAAEVARNGNNSSNSTMVEEGQTSSFSLMENEESAVVGLRDTSSMPAAELEGRVENPTAVPIATEMASDETDVAARVAEQLSKQRELQVIAQAVQVPTKEAGDNDDDDDEDSSICGLSRNCFFLVVAVLLLIIVGVILGVAVPLTTNNNNNDSPTPAQSPSPTAAPTACASRLDCFAKILLQNEVADAEALQDESSLQFQALHWLANEDTAVLDLDNTPTVIILERYVLAVIYFATGVEGRLRLFKSVCEWKYIICNEDDLVVALYLGKSKHEEVIFLISKDHN
jgi:hypothetical protein